MENIFYTTINLDLEMGLVQKLTFLMLLSILAVGLMRVIQVLQKYIFDFTKAFDAIGNLLKYCFRN